MSRSQEPLVSIITLNYNNEKVTCDFLESTRHLQYKNYEIIVCDMASRFSPASMIAAGNYPNTHLVLSPDNLGFSGGNNLGMRMAKGDYFFIVNNDTVVTDDLLDRLLQPFFNDSTIGVTCPKIKYFDQPDIIQYAGFKKMNFFTGRVFGVGHNEKDTGLYDRSMETYGAHGCAMMVKKEVIKKTGMFPENFFLYYEEWDWSVRIRRAGYSIWYTGDALIYHKESMSVGKENPLKVYYHTRNRILFMRRNSNLGHLAVFTVFFVFFVIPKSTVSYLFNRKFEQLRFFMKGIAWNLHSSSYSPT